MPMHLGTVVSRETHHDSGHAVLDGVEVGQGVFLDELVLRQEGVAGVDALLSGTIADPVLDGCEHVAGVEVGVVPGVALEAEDHGFAEPADGLWVCGVALVDAAPPQELGVGHTGGERPVHTHQVQLNRCDLTNLLHELGVVGGSQTDVVGENDTRGLVVVAVDGVHAPDVWDFDAGLVGRCVEQHLRLVQPLVRLVSTNLRTWPAEQVAHTPAPLGSDAGDVRLRNAHLHHLCNLGLQGHRVHDALHLGLQGHVLGRQDVQVPRPVGVRLVRILEGGVLLLEPFCRVGVGLQLAHGIGVVDRAADANLRPANKGAQEGHQA
mmetsp:Transcript_23215/g.66522  ORF Transcript_23215/g.66522 Transcript_23215/m.66522 type:complete len:322 (-) Transcript_23215:187-1152(-)